TQNMLDFTIEYGKSEPKGAARTRILSALREYLITEGQAASMLMTMGEESEKVSILVAGVLVERLLESESMAIDTIETQFVAGDITLDAAQRFLADKGYSDKRITHLLDRFQYNRMRRKRRPTKADLKGFYQDKLITIEEYKSKLMKMGYSLEDATYYVLQAGVK
ncbi:unnamed protein product, partial [marine sediment metagenome]